MHLAMNNRSREFKALQKAWYGKLRDSGFEDIEDTDSQEEYLKNWHSQYFIVRHSPQDLDATAEYYRMADAFLHRYTFDKPMDKKIWAMHAAGASLRTIAKALEIKVWLAHRTVQFLESQMRYTLALLW